jgi:hypothetical protein
MIQLFHAGTSHVVDGVTCEMTTVNEFGFEHLLDNGWHFTPKECYPKEILEEVPKKPLEDKVEKTQEALEKVLKKEAPKTADSKVTVPIIPVSGKSLKAEKSDKTTTKTAVKK